MIFDLVKGKYEVPHDWNYRKVSICFKTIGSGTTPPSTELEWYEGDIPWVTTGELREGTISETKSKISQGALNRFSALKIFPSDSLIIAMYGATIGRISKTSIPVTTNQACCVLRDSTVLNLDYVFYWFQSYKYQIITSSFGGGQPNISLDIIKSLRIHCPPLETQKQIADFLDKETTRIDTLISRKQKQIELLKEKRQVIITHAVTKGLDPNVKMKDSGVEWIGEIPEHWDTLPIKRIVSIPVTDGPHETPVFLDEGIPFVSAESIRNNRIDFTKKRGYISIAEHKRYSKKYHPKINDVYMIKSGATTGNCAIVETMEEFNIWSPLAVIRANNKIPNPHFILYSLISKFFQTQVELGWSYGTQQNIGMNVIENLPITVPTIKDQEEIVQYLNHEIDLIESLSNKIEKSITLLKEYRSSLITHAVSGQIDLTEGHAYAL